MKGPRIDHYAEHEQAVSESTSYANTLGEITFILRQAMRDAQADGYKRALQDAMHRLAEDTDFTGCTSFSSIDGMEIIRTLAAEKGIHVE